MKNQKVGPHPPSTTHHQKNSAARLDPWEAFVNSSLLISLSYFLYLFFSFLIFILFLSFLYLRFSDSLIFSLSFIISFIFFLFRLLFPVKITVCATKSPFNQVFKEIYFKINPRKNTFRKIFDTQNKKISPKTNPRKNIFLSKILNCLWFYKRNLFKNWSEQNKPSLNFFSSCAKLSPSLEIVLKISFYIEWVWFSLGKVSNLLKIQDPQKKCFWIFNIYLNIYPYLRYISYYYQEI